MPNVLRAIRTFAALTAALGITISITTHAQTSTPLGPGQYPSVAILADGRPVISAYDPVAQDLLLYMCADSACESWQTVTLDSTDNTGEYTSMLLGADGFPVIAYYDRTEKKPRIIDCANAMCSTATNSLIYTATTNNIGQYLRLALPADGRPITAYYDADTPRLLVSRCGTADCSTVNTRYVVDTPNVGEHLSLALNSSGNSVIAYYSAVTTSLKLAVCVNPQCGALVGSNAATPDNSADVGKYTAIQMGADGYPIIAYYDATSGDLRLMDCNDALCEAEAAIIIDQTDDVGRYTSMALRDGLPVIAYQDVTNGDLKLAECTGVPATPCQTYNIRTIDDRGTLAAPTGLYSSLALRPDGTPMIAYSDSAGMLQLADLSNHKPAITLPPPYSSGSVAVELGQPVTFSLIGTDPDNIPAQTLQYSMTGEIPVGASLDTDSGLFTWTPDTLEAYNVTFQVTDNGMPPKSASAALSLTVITTRQPPTLIVPALQRTAEATELSFTVSATDPDAGDTVTLGSGTLPAGATFDPVSGQFRWTPTSAQVGLHTVTFSATDGFTAPVSAEVLISVDRQVALNAGFEQGGLLPDVWQLKLPTGDIYLCEEAAYEGNCLFKFNGKPNKTTSLSQTIGAGLIVKGDTIQFSTYVKAAKAVAGKIGIVKISYNDGSVNKTALLLEDGSSGGWVALSAPPLTAIKNVHAVQLKMRYRGDRGRILIDAVSVVVQKPISAAPRRTQKALPVPPPAGFRG